MNEYMKNQMNDTSKKGINRKTVDFYISENNWMNMAVIKNAKGWTNKDYGWMNGGKIILMNWVKWWIEYYRINKFMEDCVNSQSNPWSNQ